MVFKFFMGFPLALIQMLLISSDECILIQTLSAPLIASL
jgi:hypothetical protein